ncbi:hypothetical protein FSP39_022964 [Pinctada imbricata]|uniref:Clock n=1 Tax=Pinctada imbricata TaxID=66713 RepID=A0AA88Y919_PINIB|nr:hypothetical protein FSP39_022964 [Pinctada imbricata]
MSPRTEKIEIIHLSTLLRYHHYCTLWYLNFVSSENDVIKKGNDLFTSDYLGDDFEEEGGRNCKRVNRNLSEKKRRDQFNMLVNELCSMVSTSNKKMDKSTVLKSTIAFLKSYQETAVQAQAHEIKEDWKPSFLSNDEFMHLMLEAMDSFLLVFTQQGTILYVSESVTSLLGHLPNDLVNEQVYEFIHESEKQNLYNMLYHFSMSNAADQIKDEDQLSFSCHFLRGSLCSSQDSPVYEIVKFSGFQHWSRDKLLNTDEDSMSSSQFNGLGSSSDNSCFCCTVRLQNSQIIRDMFIMEEAKSEFTSRHSLEWKFLFLDHRAPPIIGYLPFEVLGTSGYDYYHPDDLEKIAKCHEQLMQTGEGMSSHYRFLTKGQQWIWIKTRYYITYHQWNSKPEFVVCSNFVVSYADVKDQVKKELGLDEKSGSGSHLKHRRSPSQCSVTSGGRPRSNWSSSTVESATQDRNISGSQISDQESADSTPHSTHITRSNLPNTISQHIQLLLQQRYLHQQPAVMTTAPPTLYPVQPRTTIHGIDTQGMLSLSSDKVGMFAGKPNPEHHVVPAVTQAPIMTTMLNSAVQVQGMIQSPDTTGLPPQLHLTPIQRQLHEQLREKSLKLQKTIMKQQEELQQIIQQLAMAQQGVFPMLAITTGNPGAFDTQPIVQQPKTVNAPMTVGMQGHPMQMPGLGPVIPIQPAPQVPHDQQFLPFQLMPQEAEYMLSYSSESPQSSKQ